VRRINQLALSAVSMAALGSALIGGAATTAEAAGTHEARHGAVYVLSNQTRGNDVLAYDRGANGHLGTARHYPTGGTGTGAALGSQNAVVLDASGSHLFAVNAGSNSITSFEVTEHGLRRLTTLSSGGTTPVSISVRGDRVYVLNAGGAGNVSGFDNERGVLHPLPGSTRPLSGAATSPAQVSITPDGRQLVVTEKATQLIDVYRLDRGGRTTSRTSILSSGATPFGFDFTPGGRLAVSEAGPSAASTYHVYNYGLRTISASVPNTEAAACWLKVTDDGRFAYTGNGGGSQSVSGYRVRRNSSLSLLDQDGRTGTAAAGVSDIALSHGSRYLYARVADGTIGAFAVGNDGSLSPLPVGSGVPTGSAGIAAR
jgi:6-phosphogluconolactonase